MLTQGSKSSVTHRGELFSKVVGYLTNRSAKRRIVRQAVQTQPQAVITVSQVQAKVPVSILHLRGALNARSYRDLIAKAKEVYQAGGRHLILDMSDVPAVGVSSMLALHSIAVLLRGEEPLDPEAGWDALRAVARDLEVGGLQQHFKLLNPNPEVKETLEQAGFEGFLEIHSNLETAIASF
jgi:anti-anti-sigma regulatory factor